jgi:hypothetical protein
MGLSFGGIAQTPGTPRPPRNPPPLSEADQAMIDRVTTGDPEPFARLTTPDPAPALLAAEQASQFNAQRARAEADEVADRLAATTRCDGCHVVSPRARAYEIAGLGHGCCDCAELALSPSRPKWWRSTLSP